MNRRFLNLIVQDTKTRVNSLYLVDPWKHLFHPPSAPDQQQEASDAKPKPGSSSTDRLKLQKSQFKFESSPREIPKPTTVTHPFLSALLNHPQFRFVSDPPTAHPFFCALLRENSLLLTDSSSSTDQSAFLYDADLNSAMGIKAPHFPKGPDCVCFPATASRRNLHVLRNAHSLYVLDLSPPPNPAGASSTFEVLTCYCNDMTSQPQLKPNYKNSVNWRTLPPPPFPTCSSVMVDGSTILVSTVKNGTYIFDVDNDVWTRAGDWVLPFYGTAEHVPELGLSFALSAADSSRLCAFHPAGAGLPTLRHTFDYYLDLPEKWSPYKRRLLNLGSGNFCIVSFCKTMKQRESAILTGVEVKPSNDGQLRMINHMSKRISLGSHSSINRVL